MNSQKHLKQFSDELVKSLAEALHAVIIVLLSSWSSLQTWRQQQTEQLFNHITNKSEHLLHYLLPTTRDQSVIDWLQSANTHYSQRLTDSKTLLFAFA